MTAMAPTDWSAAERAAWRPFVRMGPAQWAEAYRVLGTEQTSQPGPVRLSRMPHTRGFLSLLAMPGIIEVWAQKCAQSGFSETIRHYLGWLADQNPCPVMLVLPDEKKGRQIFAERIIPLFNQPAPLRALHTGIKRDQQLGSVHLVNGFTLFLGWAGSPSSLASHPIRVGVADEVDKFPPFSGSESDPVSLLRERLKTFQGQRQLIALSTPTVSDGPICQGREACPVQLRYLIACPACSHWQPVEFQRLKYPQALEHESSIDHAERVEFARECVYPCSKCLTEIPESAQKSLLTRGVWGAVAATDEPWFDAVARRAAGMPGGADAPDEAYAGLVGRTQEGSGLVTAGWPKGRRVGVQIGDVDIARVPWSDTAAKWIRCNRDTPARMAFINNNLGQPFVQLIARATGSAFGEKVAAAKLGGGTVPAWAHVLLATADVQKDHFYYVVRAWGFGFRSARVAHGLALSMDDLRRITLETSYRVEGGDRSLRCAQLAIDAGYDTQNVYRAVLRDPARVKAVRGENEQMAQPITLRRGTYKPPPGTADRAGQVWVHRIDTNHFKDRLTAMIAGEIEDVSESGEVVGRIAQWDLNAVEDDDYTRQMTAEHKVYERKGRSHIQRWKKISEHADNHYWDCEVYQVALADIVRVDAFSQKRPKLPQPKQDYKPELPPPPGMQRRPLGTRGPIRTRY